ncbi:MAG: hypothetical protein M0003_17905 [Acidithiobacillus sp.]|nr:hypothetical protein [Acidithiobacillus sp.]
MIRKSGQFPGAGNIRFNDNAKSFEIVNKSGRGWPLFKQGIQGVLHKNTGRNFAVLHCHKIAFFGSGFVGQRLLRLQKMRWLNLHQTELLLDLPYRRFAPSVVMRIGDHGTVGINT